MTCEDCGCELTVATTTKERPYVDRMTGVGEPVYCVGLEIGMCPAHGDQGVTYPRMAEFLDMIAYEVAKVEFAKAGKRPRRYFLLHCLMDAMEDQYPWLRRMYDPSENEKPPKEYWFGYWIDGKLFMEFGARLKAVS